MKHRFLCAAMVCSLMAPLHAGFYIAPAALYQKITARHVSFEGVSPRWALGYDMLFTDSFYTSVEIFADYPYASLNTHRSVHELPNIRPQYSYGISLLPGVMFDDYVNGFLRLGGLMTNFSQYNRKQKAYQIGVGIDYRLAAATSLRGEYDFVGYQVLDDVGQPHSNQGSIGIVYRFDCWGQEQQCG